MNPASDGRIWMDAAASRIALVVVAATAAAALLEGADWVTTHWLPHLMTASSVALATALVLLLLSTFDRAREYTGAAIVSTSYVFWITAWLASCALTWALGGGWATLLGIAFFGWGVIPLALALAVCKGMWPDFWLVTGLLGAMLATSLGGGAIVRSRMGHDWGRSA